MVFILLCTLSDQIIANSSVQMPLNMTAEV